MSDFTATGYSLAKRLETWIPRLVSGLVPKSAGVWIAAGLDRADLKLRRQALLQAILARVDPEQSLSTWQCAKWIAEALQRLERGLPGIRSGRRPASELERLLVEWLEAGGPRCARRIHDALMGESAVD